MASVTSLNVVSRGFDPRSGQAEDYQVGVCCFSAVHAVLGGEDKDSLAWNHDNVSGLGDVSARGLLFQSTNTIQIQVSLFVWYKADIIIILLKINFFSP